MAISKQGSVDGRTPRLSADVLPASSRQLLGTWEIAEICQVGANAVSNWRARDETFPAAIAELHCGPIFVWSDVLNWLLSSGRVAEVEPGHVQIARTMLPEIRATVRHNLAELARAVETKAETIKLVAKAHRGGEHDWWYGLPERERAYLARAKWVGPAGMSPDFYQSQRWPELTIDDAMAKWLEAVRIVECWRAVRAGRQPRYDTLTDDGYSVAMIFQADADAVAYIAQTWQSEANATVVTYVAPDEEEERF